MAPPLTSTPPIIALCPSSSSSNNRAKTPPNFLFVGLESDGDGCAKGTAAFASAAVPVARSLTGFSSAEKNQKGRFQLKERTLNAGATKLHVAEASGLLLSSPDTFQELRKQLLRSRPASVIFVCIHQRQPQAVHGAEQRQCGGEGISLPAHGVAFLEALEKALGKSMWNNTVLVEVGKTSEQAATAAESAALTTVGTSETASSSLFSESQPSSVTWDGSDAATSSLITAASDIICSMLPFVPEPTHPSASAASATAPPLQSSAMGNFEELDVIASHILSSSLATAEVSVSKQQQGPAGAFAQQQQSLEHSEISDETKPALDDASRAPAPAPAPTPAPTRHEPGPTCAPTPAAPQYAPAYVPAFASLSLAFAPPVVPSVSARPLPSSSITPSIRTSKATPKSSSPSPSSFLQGMDRLEAPAPSPSLSASSSLAAHHGGASTLSFQKACNSPMPVMSALQTAAAVAAADRAAAVLGGGSARQLKVATSHVTAFPDLVRLPSSGQSFSAPMSAAGARKVVMVWFRNDLRVHDNEALHAANDDGVSVLPVYCFDPRDYCKSPSGFDRTGPYRARFLLQCVSDLRDSLRARGSDLVVRVGKPEVELRALAKVAGATSVYAHQEVTHEESVLEERVAAALQEERVETRFFWGSTLYHTEDLPFSLNSMPSSYGAFREAVKSVKVRATLETPQQLKGLPARSTIRPGDVPTLNDLGLASPPKDNHHQGLKGGETEALSRLSAFLAEVTSTFGAAAGGARTRAAAGSSSTSSSLLGAGFSCKISPWLAMGCLSARRMYEELQTLVGRAAAAAPSSQSTPAAAAAAAVGTGKVEGVNGKNGVNLDWLVFELLWRDFFRFITKKYAATHTKQAVVAPAPAMACA